MPIQQFTFSVLASAVNQEDVVLTGQVVGLRHVWLVFEENSDLVTVTMPDYGFIDIGMLSAAVYRKVKGTPTKDQDGVRFHSTNPSALNAYLMKVILDFTRAR